MSAPRTQHSQSTHWQLPLQSCGGPSLRVAQTSSTDSGIVPPSSRSLLVTGTRLGAARLARAVRGDNDLAEALFRDALDEADAAGDPVGEARIAGNHAYASWRAGRPLDVERVARAELARLEARGVVWLRDQLALSRAVALFSLGRLAAIMRGDLTAAAATVDAVGAMACADDPTVVSEVVLCRVVLALARGDVRAAVDDARRGLEAAPCVRRRSQRFWRRSPVSCEVARNGWLGRVMVDR